jgi:hypothetical protein
LIIEFSTEVSTHQVQEPEQDYYDNVPYSYRGETGTDLNNVTAALSSDQDPANIRDSDWGESLTKDMPGVGAGDLVHVVVVVYQSGDTFGLDGGHTKVLDAFTDVGEAAALRVAVRAHGKSDFRMKHNGQEYYCPWAGYFEHVESIHVWGVTVKAHHEYRSRW